MSDALVTGSTPMDRPLGSGYLFRGPPLGSGATGAVYAGHAKSSGAPIAAKLLHRRLVSDPKVVAEFLGQAALLTSINHPNVVRVIDLVAESGEVAIVMELVSGLDLRRYLEQRSTLPPALVARFGRELLAGAAAVHAATILHLDIKPENVLVDSSSSVQVLKLTDFGVARLIPDSQFTRLTGLKGTPEYMAPEVIKNKRVTQAADLYAIGIVLYELICGRTPFAGRRASEILNAHVSEAVPRIQGAPEPLWAIVESLLAKDPRQRLRRAARTTDTLAALETSLLTLPPLPAVASPAAGPAGQWKLVAAQAPRTHAKEPPVNTYDPGSRFDDQLSIVTSSRPAGRAAAIRKALTNRVVVPIVAALVAAAAATLITLQTRHNTTTIVPVFAYQVVRNCAGGKNCLINTRTGPGTNFAAKEPLPGGVLVEIVCQVNGQYVPAAKKHLGSSVWDKLRQGDYVSDLYINTSGNGSFTPQIPRC